MLQSRARQILDLSDGRSIAYFDAGQSRPVVLIHGTITTSHEMVLSLFEPLSARYRVIAVDRPGHGLSTRRRFEATPNAQAGLIIEGVRTLGLHRPIIVGHSLGATVAVEMALSFPEEIAGVVAIAPIAFPEPRLEHFVFGPRSSPGLGDVAAGFDDLGPDVSLLPILWRAMFLPQDMPQRFRDCFPFEEVKTGRCMLSTGEDAMATAPALARSLMRYPSCRVPVTIIVGDRDIVVNPRLHGRALAQLLPSGKLVSMPGYGHMLHHFEPSVVLDAVEEIERASS